MYFSLVYSPSTVCHLCLGLSNKTQTNTIHNRIIKTISWSSYRCHVTPLYSQLNLLKLEGIHPLEIAKLMHNFHSNRMPNTFTVYLLLLILSTPMKLEVPSLANTSVIHSAPNMEKDQSNSKAQECGSK